MKTYTIYTEHIDVFSFLVNNSNADIELVSCITQRLIITLCLAFADNKTALDMPSFTALQITLILSHISNTVFHFLKIS
jgi:hypothetical protein